LLRRKPFNHQLQTYVKAHFSLYIFTIILFIMGLIFGSFIVHSLSTVQKEEMVTYLSHFFHDINTNQQITTPFALKQMLYEHIKYLALFWFLGLSIIGMPLIFLLIFMKGFVIGFTISFLISGLKWKGLLFSLVSIIPQNLIIVPVYLMAGVAGILFSMSLIRSRGRKKTSNYHPSFLSYTGFIMILFAILFIAAGFEAYISPLLMKQVSGLIMN